MRDWLAVDEDGLAQTLEDRGKEFAVFELIQNSWDESATSVAVRLDPVPHKPLAKLVVTDDSPDGWKAISDAWTLFAPSYKKGNAEQRGRFNAGEKMVLAICKEARLSTMQGTVVFDEDGRKLHPRQKTDVGTVFEATLRLTRTEIAEITKKVRMLLPPKDKRTWINGEEVKPRTPVVTVEGESLPTVIGDADGVLRRSVRKTDVEFHETRSGETAMIYEMGIPVVETFDRWHVNVLQKVPLNTDRDNVPPSYLRRIRALALNSTHSLLHEDEVVEPWAQEAAASPEVDPEALKDVLDKQYGKKRVMFDPSDVEGTKIAMSRGYNVVHGRSLSGGVIRNIRKFRQEGNDFLLPAGQVTPSPKPYAPDGDPVDTVQPDVWMTRVGQYARMLASYLIGREIVVRFVRGGRNFSAAYGPGGLDFNMDVLGKRWFRIACVSEDGLLALDELLVHELAHETSIDHLSSKFHHAQAKLAARLARFCREQDGVMP